MLLTYLLYDIYAPRERSSGGYIEITLSVRLSVPLSVQIRVRPITFLWFDIGLPYLAHGCITMGRCVTYIQDPDTTLKFDLKVNFIGFLTCFCVRPITFVWFDIGLPYLAHWCITMRRCVAYIHDPDTTLNFYIKVKFIGFLTCFRVRPITFFWIDIGLPYLAHGCITIRQYVAYIHDPDSMLTFDLKVKFKGFGHVFMYDL